MTTILAAALAKLLTLALSVLPLPGDLPPSISGLFDRLPDLPEDASEATKWIDRNGDLIHPGLLALRADIKVYQNALARISENRASLDKAQGAAVVQDISQGMSLAGIDENRIKREPINAKLVEARIRQMTPQHVVAVELPMPRQMSLDRKYLNQAKAAAGDSLAVREVAEVSAGRVSHLEEIRQIWKDSEKQVARIRDRPLNVDMTKPPNEWESIGCNLNCRAQWNAYATKAFPQRVARDTEILHVHRAALRRSRLAIADGVRSADYHLSAAQYGANSLSELHQMQIDANNYIVLGEILALSENMIASARAAATASNCGKKIVLAADASCI